MRDRVTVTKRPFTTKSSHKMSQNSANPSGLQEAEMKNPFLHFSFLQNIRIGIERLHNPRVVIS
jgi:hypothetical protein